MLLLLHLVAAAGVFWSLCAAFEGHSRGIESRNASVSLLNLAGTVSGLVR